MNKHTSGYTYWIRINTRIIHRSILIFLAFFDISLVFILPKDKLRVINKSNTYVIFAKIEDLITMRYCADSLVCLNLERCNTFQGQSRHAIVDILIIFEDCAWFGFFEPLCKLFRLVRELTIPKLLILISSTNGFNILSVIIQVAHRIKSNLEGFDVLGIVRESSCILFVEVWAVKKLGIARVRNSRCLCRNYSFATDLLVFRPVISLTLNWAIMNLFTLGANLAPIFTA